MKLNRFFARHVMKLSSIPPAPNALLPDISAFVMARRVRCRKTLLPQDGSAVLMFTGAGIATVIVLQSILAAN
jgi:hypothetical protein